MKPPPFDYVAPSTLDEALDILASGDDEAKVLAGGQSLLPLLALRLAYPTTLVDLNGVAELAGIERRNGSLRVGAMTRHRAAERSTDVAEAAPLVAAAIPLIGHVAIRSRGTIGGSLAHADPAAELPAVALALDATFIARSRANGERQIAAADFFDGYFTTALEPGELLTAIDFPAPAPGTGVCVEEVARRHGDFAMVGAVTSVTVADNTITDARIALINMAGTPLRARDAEQALVGSPPAADLFAQAGALAVEGTEPSGDLHASPEYRRRVGAVCVRRALTTAVARATGGAA